MGKDKQSMHFVMHFYNALFGYRQLCRTSIYSLSLIAPNCNPFFEGAGKKFQVLNTVTEG